LKIVVLADIHGRLDAIYTMETPLSKADIVLAAGDITDFGDAKQAETVIGVLGQFCRRVLAVPGNCDPPSVGAYLIKAGVSLHGQAVCVEGRCFVGVGGALSNVGGETAFAETLDRAYQQCDSSVPLVVVTHQPAWNTTLDTVAAGRHGGSRAIREFIERTRPQLAVSGHFHDLPGTDRLGPTTLVNPGPAKQGHYAEIDLDGGEVRVRFF